MKKIFILSNSLQTGGAEKQAIILTSVLRCDYKTFLVVFNDSNKDPKLLKMADDQKININFINGSTITAAYKLYLLIKKEKPYAIFSYLAKTNFLNAVVGSMAGVKIKIGGIRNSFIPLRKRVLQRFLHNSLLNASVSNSFSGLTELGKRGYDINKMFVIHNAYLGNYSHGNSQGDEVKILTIGRFVPQKDYLTSLNAFKLASQYCLEKNIKSRYIIIGYGELLPVIERFIKENKINNVDIIVNPPNIEEYLISSDIYLSTSLFEGLSNSIMEAMASSLAIVATNVGDNPHLVKDNINGFLLPVLDTNGIAEKLKILMLDKEKRIIMGNNSCRYLLENFSVEKFKINYMKILEKFNEA